MGPIAARHARTVLEHVERIVAIELLVGAEALDQRLALLAAEAGSAGSAVAPGADGTGSAGRPPGRPSGSVLAFGRHIGWSLGEVARVDPGYLEWLEDRREGSPYRAEIDDLLKLLGRRRSTDPDVPATHRQFGRAGRTRTRTSR